jgi:hypothetical protein
MTYETELNKCACGCGEMLDFSKGRKTKRFIHGHRIRIKNEGVEARKNKEPWNKNKKRTEEEKKKMSEGQKKSFLSGKRKKYIKTEQHKAALKAAVSKPKSQEHLQKIITARENNPAYELVKQQISEKLKQKYRDGVLISNFYIDGRYKNDPNSQYNQYNGEFDEQLKFSVRKRDNWTCQICLEKRSTTCHHINEDKTCNVPENLIVLCRSCHSKYHSLKNEQLREQQRQIFLEIVKQRIFECSKKQ